MAQDEISTWLKASAENKITTKNTWKATLIEHFSDISSFKECQGVNFKKAGCALEGCVKVYSTRVDDVTENTSKLLGLFGREEESKRKAGKRRTDFIEKNLASIDLKETQSVQFYDPTFLSVLTRTDELFLVSVLSQTNAGMFMFENTLDTIVYEDAAVDFEFDPLPVCASLKEFRGVENVNSMMMPDEYSHKEEYVEAEDFQPDGYENVDYDVDIPSENNSNSPEIQAIIDNNKRQPVYEETPFGYFKGWAGPGHWKVAATTRKTVDKTRKPREGCFINFLEDVDYTFMFEKANTTMGKEQILERRRNKNLMPEDYSYKRSDLYKYLVKDGHFTSLRENDGVVGSPELDVGTQAPETSLDFPDSDYQADDGPDLSFRLEHSLIIEDKPPAIQLKVPKIQKKVDIKKLKENVHKLMHNSNQTLCNVYKGIPGLYAPKEGKDISLHMCFISLLHLANENSYELLSTNDDVCIKR